MRRRLQGIALDSLRSARSLALCAALGVLALGCGKLTATGGGGSSSSSASSRTPAVAEPSPKVRITSPQRASFLVPGRVAVEGYTEQAAPTSTSAIQAVRLNGQPVTLEPDGTFRGFVDLIPGLNIIEASVLDVQGKTGGAAVGVLAGEYRTMGQEIDQAALARINDTSLGAVGKILESVVWSLNLTQLLQGANPIVGASALWGGAQATIDILQVNYRDLRVDLDTRPDGVHVRAEFFDATVDVDAVATLFSAQTSERISLTADSVGITGRFVASARADRTLHVEALDPAMFFQNFQAHPTMPLLVTIEPLVRDLVRDAIADAIADLITQTLQPEIDQTLLDVLTPSQPFQLFGNDFLVDARMESISFDDDGFTFQASFDAPEAHQTPWGQAAPGSYATTGALPAVIPGPGVWVTINDDAINRLSHGCWASGALDFTFDDAFCARNGLNLPIALELGSITQFLPELIGIARDTAPVALRARANLPPLAEFSGQPDLVKVHMGELELELTIDRGQGPEPFLKAVIQASVGFNVALTNGGLQFSAVSHPTLKFEIIEEPLVEMDNRRIETMLGVVLTPLIPSLFNEANLIAIPHLSQLTVFNTHSYPDGAARDHLTVTGDMTR